LNKVLSNNLEKYITFIILLILISTFFYQSVLFIYQNLSPFFSDSQFKHSLRFYNMICGKPNQGQLGYPPMVYAATFLIYRILGISITSARTSVLLFAVVFSLSLYGIGKEIGGNMISGLAVLAFGLGCPHILNHSTLYYIDFPETAMSSLAIYFFIKSDNFNNTLFSILAGVSVGLAFLTKWSALFFITMPFFSLLYSLFCRKWKQLFPFFILWIVPAIVFLRLKAYYSLDPSVDFPGIWKSYYFLNIFLPLLIFIGVTIFIEKYGKLLAGRLQDYVPDVKVLNFFRAGSIAACIAGVWLISNMLAFKEKIVADLSWSRETWAVPLYINQLMQNGFFFLPLFILVGIVAIFVVRDVEPEKRLFLSVCVLNLVILSILFSVIGYLTVRYYISIFIFSSIICGWWMGKTGKIGRLAAITVFVLSMLSISGWVVFTPQNKMVEFVDPYPFRARTFRFNFLFPCGVRPDRKIYDFNRLLKILKEDSRNKEHPGKVLLFYSGEPSNPQYYRETIEYELYKNGIIKSYYDLKEACYMRVRYAQYGEMAERIRKYRRFIIIHTREDMSRPVFDYIKPGKEACEIIYYSQKMPDSTIITLVVFKPYDYQDYMEKMQEIPN